MNPASELVVNDQQYMVILEPALVVASPAKRVTSLPRVGRVVHHTPLESSAARCWDALADGRMTILGHATNETHASLVVDARARKKSMLCNAGNAVTLEQVLTGCAQKIVALDFEKAASTVSQRIKMTLSAFGLECPVRHAPLALAVIAASHAIDAAFSPPGFEQRSCHEPDQLELRMLRPESVLRHFLTSAEYQVLQAVFDGQSHRQVGALRRRSPRTIANQLRSIAEKLGVCGRFQSINLAVKLSTEAVRIRPTLAPALPKSA